MQLFDRPSHVPDDPLATSGAVFLRSGRPRTEPQSDEDRQALVRDRISQDFHAARGWAELQGRLLLKGYVLRPQGERLTLCHRADGKVICRASELGVPYAELRRRFGLPFPSANPMTQQ
ncbi:hypothetical protein [Tropicibacter sp. S64]|uniref:hypothetical protein n=1 Tax=Tropicibacter sp. S64 TaxID=3415122 RepID=UPI003C7DA52E